MMTDIYYTVHDDNIPPNSPYASDRMMKCTDLTTAKGQCNKSCATQNRYEAFIFAVQNAVSTWFQNHKEKLKYIMGVGLLLAYGVYLVYSVYLNFHRAVPLLVFTAVPVLMFVHHLLTTYTGNCLSRTKQLLTRTLKRWNTVIKIIFSLLVITIMVTFLYLEGSDNPDKLRAAAGFCVIILVLFITSANPAKVIWRPVIAGLLTQFTLALLVLKWKPGFHAFHWLGSQLSTFFSYSNAGAKFVFDNGSGSYQEHFFAMKVLPLIVFFSSIMSVLYHSGLMQRVMTSLGSLMQFIMGTTAPESVNAAANIFIGQTEAPLLIRPFLADLTQSELHAVMTGGFATIAGGVMAAYIAFGVPAAHLISASVMAAPAALAVSKLTYPETEISKMKKIKHLTMPSKEHHNILEAASSGASASIAIVANIAVNLIAFISILAFVNAVFAWFGSLVEYPQLSFQLLCSYVFMPLCWLLGVEWADCHLVGQLVGTKIFVNEFVAYTQLSQWIENREAGTYPCITERSASIAVYALCGFANLSAVGCQLGGLAAIAPTRREDMSRVAVRALLAGIVTSLLTAALAALMIPDSNSMSNNSTSPCQRVTDLPVDMLTAGDYTSTHLLNTTTSSTSTVMSHPSQSLTTVTTATYSAVEAILRLL